MEDDSENISTENKNPWNKRQRKSSLTLYLLLALFSLVIAYALSGTAG